MTIPSNSSKNSLKKITNNKFEIWEKFKMFMRAAQNHFHFVEKSEIEKIAKEGDERLYQNIDGKIKINDSLDERKNVIDKSCRNLSMLVIKKGPGKKAIPEFTNINNQFIKAIMGDAKKTGKFEFSFKRDKNLINKWKNE